ncbi:DUF222 domain-containing protein [Rhodococcus sp. ABRD24]|uniref:DUF222 domain-containing protein n=1 Tax=Rhodococcus sp. ABRD24 TaxID=2507582 RepID=UPI001038DE45|nr:DUF222 domain-containing protein [Rhodococcus sp. ABRD24]QBJ95483.1 DUF222 domain-containing protein [Rhodococcus sp. ABRD24]
MFDIGGGVGEALTDAVVGDAARFVELSVLARVENVCAARKVLLAGELTLSALERDVRLRGGDVRDCGNEAIAEVSTRLGCSHTMASHFCDLGVDLRLRLPVTRAAFLAGDVDYARVWRIHCETTGLSAETVVLLEAEIVAGESAGAPHTAPETTHPTELEHTIHTKAAALIPSPDGTCHHPRSRHEKSPTPSVGVRVESYVEPSLKRIDNQPPHNASDIPKLAWIIECRRVHGFSLLSSDLAARARRWTGPKELVRVGSGPHRNLISREADIDEPRLMYHDPVGTRHGCHHRRDIRCPRACITSATATSNCKSKSHPCEPRHHATYPHRYPLLSPAPYDTIISPTRRSRT